MTMPKWHEMMRPVLVALDSGETLGTSDLSQVIFDEFSLTEEERSERLEKSGQLRYLNRMHWAITDLRKAELLENGEKRGTYRITDAGREFLSRHDSPFDAKTLMEECEPFREWKEGYLAKEREKHHGQSSSDVQDDRSPLEVMQDASEELNSSLADELLQSVMQQPPAFFEYLVGRLLASMGYGESVEGAVNVTGQPGDEGIDGVVKEDRLGFDSVYYQAKRWGLDQTVGRPALQAFVGALSGKGATKGLFITTARFSETARRYAEGIKNQRLVLIDGQALARLMIDYNVGVTTKATFEVKQVDADFFSD
jgi:restriction system protein